MSENDIPLHFMKVLDFDNLTKPQLLFLFVLFDAIFDACTKEQIKGVF